MPRTVKIPKKIAGVKVPRQVRKKVKKTIKAHAGPVVREIAAAAIGAASAKAGGPREAGERIARRFEGRTSVEIDGDRIAEAFRSAALNGLRSFLEGLEDGLAKAEAKAGDHRPAPPARPKAAKKPKKPAKPKKPSAAKPAARAPGV